MKALPAWADTAAGRALLDEIVASAPESTVTRGAWIEGGGQRRYHGPRMATLRRMRSDYLDALYAQPWERVAHRLDRAAHETADALIERLTDARPQRRAA